GHLPAVFRSRRDRPVADAAAQRRARAPRRPAQGLWRDDRRCGIPRGCRQAEARGQHRQLGRGRRLRQRGLSGDPRADRHREEILSVRQDMTARAELEGRNLWDELMALRDQQREEKSTGIQVIRRKDLPRELNSHGLMRWYMHPGIKDIVLSTLSIYE